MKLTPARLRRIVKEEVSKYANPDMTVEASNALQSFSGKYPNLVSRIDPNEWTTLYVKTAEGVGYGGGSMDRNVLTTMFLRILEKSV